MCADLAAHPRAAAVEHSVVEGKLLGVALDPLDLDPLAGRLLASLFEQLRGKVEPGHLRPRARGRNRRVAGAAGHVEHPHARLDAGALDHQLADQ